ncbi:50S ribosomal protein L19 [Jiulongibacter sediminis]|jgi:large subunit ribosomal protein L19|uniref:Large ribosomal subunit protein bL19 n=1 Tax=Jiulongibacter sediminis TaxID=1605367 RepID=A0A0P7C1V7_9BACT|nr:50S ribosomal protein L19 [Jiulongibacter sediminis]KPM48011.1 50S ribosomal protein L19 [Jiulongibacter sediminis]TBX24193.1 50S ribosomal protein L19 [Jiulongibacter sediminis]
MSDLVREIEASLLPETNEIPDFKAGDTVNVHVRIKEGNKERIQVFQGAVIQRKNYGTTGETFTVRKISNGIGVERIFPILSPSIEKIEVLRKGKVRRAKLYYLRNKHGKAAKIKELKK